MHQAHESQDGAACNPSFAYIISRSAANARHTSHLLLLAHLSLLMFPINLARVVPGLPVAYLMFKSPNDNPLF